MVTFTPRPKQNVPKSPLLAAAIMQELPRRATSLIDLEFDFDFAAEQQSVLSIEESPPRPSVRSGFAEIQK